MKNFRIINLHDKLCRVIEYDGDLINNYWLVFARYDGGNVQEFLDNNDKIRQFV